MASLEYFVCDHQATCADCRCGKVWFTCRDDDRDTLRAKAKREPEKYVESEDDGVAFGWISGEQVVFGCGCGFIERHEEWIREHEEVVREFLRKLGAERAEEATRLAAII